MSLCEFQSFEPCKRDVLDAVQSSNMPSERLLTSLHRGTMCKWFMLGAILILLSLTLWSKSQLTMSLCEFQPFEPCKTDVLDGIQSSTMLSEHSMTSLHLGTMCEWFIVGANPLSLSLTL